MKRRWLLWGCLALVAGGCLALSVPPWRYALLATLTGEPLYHGRPLGYWCDAAANGDEGLRREAAGVLLEALKHDDPRVRRRAGKYLWLAPLRAEMVPALTEALTDEDVVVRGQARYCLARVDPKDRRAFALLVGGLKDGRAGVRSGVAAALKEIGPPARAAIPDLVAVWKGDPDRGVREAAAFALGKLGRKPNPAVPLLRAALKGADPEWAARSLGEAGPDAADAVPDLIEALGHPSWGVRGNAAEALGRIGRADQRVVAALARALKDEDPFVRLKAARAHWRLKRQADVVVPVLAEVLGTDCLGEVEAFWTLGEIGPPARDAIPAVRAALRDERPWRRDLAARTLAEMEGRAADKAAGQ